MRKLDRPAKEDFDEKTWAAVAYAYDWALFRGNVQDPDVIEDFQKHYSAEEQETIVDTIRIMDFANRFNNSLAPPLNKEKKLGSGKK